MEVLFYGVISFFIGGTTFLFTSLKIINEGEEALVERLGQYHKKLTPGLNFVIPILDQIVIEETIRERVLDIPPQKAISQDNVSLEADAVVYWKIMDLEKTFYGVEKIEEAIENLVVTTLRSALGQLELDQTYASREQINQSLLRQLDEVTGTWGVKVTRIEVKEITPAKMVMDALEQERAAESRKRATLQETEGTVKSIHMLAQALGIEPNTKAFLEFLLAQRYVEANQRLGESPNSKILFMDPKSLNESLAHLIEKNPDVPSSSSEGLGGHTGNGGVINS